MNKLSITRDESTAVKGLLIILIILGHAQPLIHLPSPLRSFFYGFHVHCFMILPLLYPIKQLNKERIKNYVARLIVPYSLLFFLFFSGQLMMSIISSSSAVTSSPMDFVKAVIGGVYSMIMGGYFPLRDSIDVVYLWFLPAMFSLLIIRDYYMMASRLNKTILLSLGAIFYFLLWVCLYLPYFVGIKETIMYCSPFSVWQALGALFMGVTTITILEKAYSCNMGNTIKAVLLIAFVAMCAIYFMTPRKSVYWIIPNAFTPIIAFMFIYYFRDVLSRIRLFRKFGLSCKSPWMT